MVSRWRRGAPRAAKRTRGAGPQGHGHWAPVSPLRVLVASVLVSGLWWGCAAGAAGRGGRGERRGAMLLVLLVAVVCALAVLLLEQLVVVLVL